DVEVGVGVGPFHLRHDTLDGDGFAAVIVRRPRMVGRHRCRVEQQAETYGQNPKLRSHFNPSARKIEAILETILYPELQDSRIAADRVDLAECPGIVVGDGIAPVEVIKEVEGLEPELEGLCSGY